MPRQLNASQKEDGSLHPKSQVSTSPGDTPSFFKHKREDRLKDLVFAKMVEKFTLEAEEGVTRPTWDASKIVKPQI